MQYVRLVWDSIWEPIGLTKLGNHLWGEVPFAVKLSPVLFVVCLVVITVLFSKGCDKNSQIKELKKDKEFLQNSFMTTGQSNAALVGNYQLEVQKLNEKNHEKDNSILQLIQERDKAQIESQNDKNALASWIVLAKSSNTNTPLTERLDFLAGWVEANTRSLTNALSGLNLERPEFDLYVNDILITNGAIISLKESRKIQLRVVNTTQTTAEQLSIDFLAPFALDKTNVIVGNEWQIQPPVTAIKNGLWTTNTVGNNWRWIADKSVAGMAGFYPQTFEISTNFPSQKYSVIQVTFNIYSNGSKKQTFSLALTF